MFQYRGHVKKFVDYMNTKHPNIRFTFEIEDQNSLSFLNIKIIRNTEKKAFEKVHSLAFLLIFRVLFLRHIKLGCHFDVFQYTLPMKSFTKNLSSSRNL